MNVRIFQTPIMKENFNLFLRGIMNSYSQVFFSEKLLFSFILMFVTFVDPFAGFFGLMAVMITNSIGLIFGLNKYIVARGIYGFNALLVGLGLGVFFAPGWHLLAIIVLGSVLTLFIAVSLEGIIGKYSLPYLSLPFILAVWIVILATREFVELGISQRGVYTINEVYQIGGETMVQLYHWWHNLPIGETLRVYFISLGAIFFQFNVLSGVLIAAGLLYFSRIAFSLSLIGFYTAFVFYGFIGANLTELNYSYIGFNYILTAIAIGGFFVIPGKNSYLWVILIIPIVALLTISLNKVFAVFYLPVYSLPFNIMVLMFLYALKFRVSQNKQLTEVLFQYNSPEKNLYTFLNNSRRFKYWGKTSVNLPFFGEWKVTQSYDGNITHKGDWQHALDFEIYDEKGKSYEGSGDFPEDYYCFDKVVLSPADGVIEEIIDDIPDNKIGDVNLLKNWGNTIIIKHHEGLYSKLSHLKFHSVTVKKDEKVKQGQALARCGNSGRSPYPHLHFQMQTTPYIGSKTIDYPISNYILKKDDKPEFQSFQVPREGDTISNVEINSLLRNAFHFIPGKKFMITGTRNGKSFASECEVHANFYNKAYIECKKTRSRAWFENTGTIWYFTHFEGNKKDVLYYFFLACYKVQLGFYQGIQIRDSFPVHVLFSKLGLFIQDFLAPFFMFLRTRYQLNYTFIDDNLTPSVIKLNSKAASFFFNQKLNEIDSELLIGKSGIEKFQVTKNNLKIDAVCSEM